MQSSPLFFNTSQRSDKVPVIGFFLQYTALLRRNDVTQDFFVNRVYGYTRMFRVYSIIILYENAAVKRTVVLGDVWKTSMFFNIDVFKENIDIYRCFRCFSFHFFKISLMLKMPLKISFRR